MRLVYLEIKLQKKKLEDETRRFTSLRKNV